MKTARRQCLLAVVVSCVFANNSIAAQLEVGEARTFATIVSAITAASAGDVVNVHSGIYAENPNINKTITVQANPGDSPKITGQVTIGSNATIDGFFITGWTGSLHGVTINTGATRTTVKNNTINGGGVLTGSASCVYSRNSTRIVIDNNQISFCQKGVNISSGHSIDSTYENGIRISNNDIHDNPVDGIDIHGEYFNIYGNHIYNNINTNWVNTHPDGIQFIRSTVDGFSNLNHSRVHGNVIRNHTQNIFLEGWGGTDPVTDIDIYNNLLYNDATTINGVDMTDLTSVHVKAKGVEGVRIYNNYFGYMKGAGQIQVTSSSTPGTVIIKNNIFNNSRTGGTYYAVYTRGVGDVTPANLDHNIYNMAGSYLFKNGDSGPSYTSIWNLQSAGYELKGMAGDPTLDALPAPTLQAGSIAIDNGATLGALYASDYDGITRPQGVGWDIGPYEFSYDVSLKPTPPSNIQIK